MNTSKTSVNQPPALYKLVKEKYGWLEGTLHLDYGAGAYHNMRNLLEAAGVHVIEYDKYNKAECPMNLADIYDQRPYHTVSLSNVLNVCTVQERTTIYRRVKELCNGNIYITVYEGDRSGNAGETSKGWQENKTTLFYEEELKKFFTFVDRCGKLIVVRR